MAEFKPIETQEQLDAIVGDRLKREREKISKEYEGFLSPEDAAKKYEGYLSPDDEKEKYKGYLSPDDEKEKYKGYLSPEDEKEKYKGYLSPEETAKKDAKLKGYETDSVKTRIAHELGLSYDAIGFLKGDDEKSIRKSAETLKSLVGNTIMAPLASTEPSATETKDAALKNTLKGLKGE